MVSSIFEEWLDYLLHSDLINRTDKADEKVDFKIALFLECLRKCHQDVIFRGPNFEGKTLRSF